MATQVSDSGSKTMARGSSDELTIIAQRAQAFTNASGTAIALSEGHLDEIVCRARSGSTAPEVGATLRVNGTFTGLCIQSGKELRCDDAETDTRVDTAAIRALGIRSTVVIPIKEEGRVVGVLAVFAPQAHAFTITHVAVLRTIADQISAFLQKQGRQPQEERSTESSRSQGSASTPAAKPAPVLPVTFVASTPSVSSVSGPVGIKSPAAPARGISVSRVEVVKPIVAEEVVATAAPIQVEPKRQQEKFHKQAEPKPDFSHSFGTLDAAAAPSKSAGLSGKNLAIAGAAGIVIAGAVAYFTLHSKSATPQPAQQSSTAPANVEPPAPAAVSSSPASPASSAAASSTLPETVTVTPAKPGPATKAETSRKPEKNSGSSERSSSSSNRENTPAPEKPQRTVALASGSSKIGGAKDSAPAQEAAAPSLTVGESTGAQALNSLASPTAVATPSMLTQSQLEPIQVIRKVAPVYPLMAKQRMMSGTVVIQGTVGVNGKITNLQLVSGPQIFRDAAFEAVKQWQFKPARLDGRSIDQSTQIRMDFVPGR